MQLASRIQLRDFVYWHINNYKDKSTITFISLFSFWHFLYIYSNFLVFWFIVYSGIAKLH